MTIVSLFLLSSLVLRSGQHIDLSEPWHEERGRVVFRGTDGTLYSVPKEDVDLEATRALATPPLIANVPGAMKFKVSDDEKKRLIAELEQNHNGTPPPRGTVLGVTMVEEQQAPDENEWAWRGRAHSYEERIRQAKEDRDLLVTKAQALRSHISGLLSLGYKPSQFSYDSTQLAYTLEAIPSAELEITRAERAYDQFREDARRMGVMPGWLR
jgi:hypothetical protein